jgi:hypothetical protein
MPEDGGLTPPAAIPANAQVDPDVCAHVVIHVQHSIVVLTSLRARISDPRYANWLIVSSRIK